ncbi:branched-chain amino acid ABC transporter permease [Leucobacter sp. USHLN153]|uniref:branched-chain amino acid ABC transporter permease n=1 Tax=Leucobacter sp. USHLN153 TaxID=3081268 RepID=UPI003017873E
MTSPLVRSRFTRAGSRAELGRLRLAVTLICAALIAILTTLWLPAAAHAADCAPSPDTGCVQGIIKTSAGDPAPGVSLELSGPAGSEAEEQNTETSDDGRWSFEVTEAGTYTVSVDAATLPKGQFFKNASSRDLEVALYDSTSALFPLTDDEAAAEAPADTPDSEATPEPNDEAPASGTADGAAEPGTDVSGTDVPGADAGADASTATPGAAQATAGDGFSWPRFWQQFASGIRMGLLLSLAALGLSLVFGTTGISNFAHAEMVTMGGMLAFLFMRLTGNVWVAGLITVAIMAAFGYLQDVGLWKPLRKRRLSLMQLMIVSIGLSIALQNLFQFFFGASILRIVTRTPDTVTIWGITLTVQSYVAMGIALLAIIGVGIAMKYTRFGRATRAVSDNPALAEASGINVDTVIRGVWTVGTALAGLAGILLGLVLNGVAWNTGWYFLLLLFAAVVLGGIGTAFGAFVGAMLIGLVVEMANIWLPGDLKHAAALFILIIVLLVRPQGLFGRKERIG